MKISKKNLFILTIIILLGLGLRFLYFHALTFGYDQARDAFQSISLLKELHPKIIGPGTDIHGLFHSPLYWYIISPIYFFSKGNPEIVRVFLIIFHTLNIITIYLIAKQLFKNEKIALLSSLFMAVSFEAVQYSRWLSNTTPPLFTIVIFFYGLWLVFKNKKVGLPLMLISWGFSVDFQLFLLYQIIFIGIAVLYLLIKNRSFFIQSLKKYHWLYVLSVFPWMFYIVSELKFKFQGSRAFLVFLFNHKSGSFDFWQKLTNFVNSLINNLAVNMTGRDIKAATIIFIVLIIYTIYKIISDKKNRGILLFLLMWLLSPGLIYPLESLNSYFLNIGNLYPLILISTFLLIDLSTRFKKYQNIFLLLSIGAICFTNGNLIFKENKIGETLFSVQYGLMLNVEKQVVDYIYLDNKGKEFAINTVTNPLLINTTWAYLFDWYARPKYSLMPHWLGYPYDDVGKEVKFNENDWEQKGKTLYLIYEPPSGIPEAYIKAYSLYENSRSRILEVKHIGKITVEKRILFNNNNFLSSGLYSYIK